MSTEPAFVDVGSGPAIVFLHGIGGNADNWAGQFAALSTDYRCIAWNMPGYGGNPELPQMTFAAMADALADTLDALGLDQVVVCGLSMGGYLAQEFAARQPQRLRGLVLMCTSAAFGEPGGEFQQKFLAARLKPIDEGKTPADIAPALAKGMLGPNAGPEVAAVLEGSMARISSRTYRAALNCLVTFDQRGNVASIPCPTLMIAGEADETAPAKVMERMAERVPDVQFHVIPGAGHIANIEAPDATNRLIATFMETLS